MITEPCEMYRWKFLIDALLVTKHHFFTRFHHIFYREFLYNIFFGPGIAGLTKTIVNE